jgi:hypothetical protein
MAKRAPERTVEETIEFNTGTELPPKFRNVLVLTDRYFSVAYCDEEGHWRNPVTGRLLDGVQRWRYLRAT